eukprot:13880981-Alexandrium_andersonii.AAC.1
MLRCEPVRMPDGRARLLPPEYLPMGKWPCYAPEQVIVLRRSNCRAFFPPTGQVARRADAASPQCSPESRA